MRETGGSKGWNGLPWDVPFLSLHAGTPGAPCLEPPLLWWFHLLAVRTCGSLSSPCVSSQRSDPRSEHREVCGKLAKLIQTQRQPGRQVDSRPCTFTLKTHKHTLILQFSAVRKSGTTGMGHQQKTYNKGQSFIDQKNKSYTWVSFKIPFLSWHIVYWHRKCRACLFCILFCNIGNRLCSYDSYEPWFASSLHVSFWC